ncbi:MAG: hypothetical protein WBF17_07465 [Phycisphaerae bacterium]
MRPVPRSRHLLAVMIFAAVAAASGYFASIEDRLSGAQVDIATAAVKRHDPGAFPHDPVFGEKKLWLFHSPAFQSLLELVLVPTDYQDLRLPFRVMSGAVTMIFLCGMYALLYAQCRSWSVSCFVSVLSCRVIEALGGAVWGVGSLESMTPAGLYVAVFPLIVLAFARYSRPRPDEPPSSQWRVLLVFAAVGLVGNFHLPTAMNVTIVLLVAYVARQRFSPRCLPMAIGCGLSALVAALPFAGYYLGIRAMMSRGDPECVTETVREAFRIAELTELYPDLLKSFLHWRMLAGALVLIVPAAAVIGRVERFRMQNVGLWTWLAVGSLFTALGLHGLSQLLGCALDTAPPVIDFLRASSLLLLPLYVMLGQAITNLFRLLRAHRRLVRWACAALMAAWMLPSDNFRVARHAIGELATAFIDEAAKPAYVLRHIEQRERRRELAAVARWAAGRDGAMFITDTQEFRMLARRPVVAGPNDARYFYYLTPGRLGEWIDRFKRQHSLLHPSTGRADGEALTQFVSELIKADPSMGEIAEWYVILLAPAAPEKPGSLKPVEADSWGRYFRLYRIR